MIPLLVFSSLRKISNISGHKCKIKQFPRRHLTTSSLIKYRNILHPLNKVHANKSIIPAFGLNCSKAQLDVSKSLLLILDKRYRHKFSNLTEKSNNYIYKKSLINVMQDNLEFVIEKTNARPVYIIRMTLIERKVQRLQKLKLDPFYCDSFFCYPSFEQPSSGQNKKKQNDERVDKTPSVPDHLLTFQKLNKMKIPPAEIVNNFKYPTFTSFALPEESHQNGNSGKSTSDISNDGTVHISNGLCENRAKNVISFKNSRKDVINSNENIKRDLLESKSQRNESDRLEEAIDNLNSDSKPISTRDSNCFESLCKSKYKSRTKLVSIPLQFEKVVSREIPYVPFRAFDTEKDKIYSDKETRDISYYNSNVPLFENKDNYVIDQCTAAVKNDEDIQAKGQLTIKEDEDSTSMNYMYSDMVDSQQNTPDYILLEKDNEYPEMYINPAENYEEFMFQENSIHFFQEDIRNSELFEEKSFFVNPLVTSFTTEKNINDNEKNSITNDDVISENQEAIPKTFIEDEKKGAENDEIGMKRETEPDDNSVKSVDERVDHRQKELLTSRSPEKILERDSRGEESSYPDRVPTHYEVGIKIETVPEGNSAKSINERDYHLQNKLVTSRSPENILRDSGEQESSYHDCVSTHYEVSTKRKAGTDDNSVKSVDERVDNMQKELFTSSSLENILERGTGEQKSSYPDRVPTEDAKEEGNNKENYDLIDKNNSHQNSEPTETALIEGNGCPMNNDKCDNGRYLTKKGLSVVLTQVDNCPSIENKEIELTDENVSSFRNSLKCALKSVQSFKSAKKLETDSMSDKTSGTNGTKNNEKNVVLKCTSEENSLSINENSILNSGCINDVELVDSNIVIDSTTNNEINFYSDFKTASESPPKFLIISNLKELPDINGVVILKENVPGTNPCDNYVPTVLNSLNVSEKLLLSSGIGRFSGEKCSSKNETFDIDIFNIEKDYNETSNKASENDMNAGNCTINSKELDYDASVIKIESRSRRHSSNKYWIPTFVPVNAVSAPEKRQNSWGANSNNCSIEDNSSATLSSNKDFSEPYITKIPIHKEKHIDESISTNRSILSIINSIDKSEMIIHKDLYITDRIMQKIKDDKNTSKPKEDKSTTEDKNNPKITPHSAIGITIVNKQFETPDNLVLFIDPRINSSSVSLNFANKGKSTLEMIKKANAIIEKEKYRQVRGPRRPSGDEQLKDQEDLQRDQSSEQGPPKKAITSGLSNQMKSFTTHQVKPKNLDKIETETKYKLESKRFQEEKKDLETILTDKDSLKTRTNSSKTNVFKTISQKKPFHSNSSEGDMNDSIINKNLPFASRNCETKIVQTKHILHKMSSGINKELFECSPYVGATVRCLAKTKNASDNYICNRNIHTPDSSKGPPFKTGINTKTVITTETEGDYVKINIDETQRYVDARIPVPFATQSSFEISGSTSRLKDHISIVDRTKAKIETMLKSGKSEAQVQQTDVLPIIDNLLAALKKETNMNALLKKKSHLKTNPRKTFTPISTEGGSLKKGQRKSTKVKYAKPKELKTFKKTVAHLDKKKVKDSEGLSPRSLNKSFYDNSEEIKVIRPNEFESIAGLKTEGKGKIADSRKEDGEKSAPKGLLEDKLKEADKKSKILELKPLVTDVSKKSEEPKYVDLYQLPYKDKVTSKVKEEISPVVPKKRRKSLDDHNLSQRDQKILKEIIKQKTRRKTTVKNVTRSGTTKSAKTGAFIKNKSEISTKDDLNIGKSNFSRTTLVTSKIIELKQSNESNPVHMKIETVMPANYKFKSSMIPSGESEKYKILELKGSALPTFESEIPIRTRNDSRPKEKVSQQFPESNLKIDKEDANVDREQGFASITIKMPSNVTIEKIKPSPINDKPGVGGSAKKENLIQPIPVVIKKDDTPSKPLSFAKIIKTTKPKSPKSKTLDPEQAKSLQRKAEARTIEKKSFLTTQDGKKITPGTMKTIDQKEFKMAQEQYMEKPGAMGVIKNKVEIQGIEKAKNEGKFEAMPKTKEEIKKEAKHKAKEIIDGKSEQVPEHPRETPQSPKLEVIQHCRRSEERNEPDRDTMIGKVIRGIQIKRMPKYIIGSKIPDIKFTKTFNMDNNSTDRQKRMTKSEQILQIKESKKGRESETKAHYQGYAFEVQKDVQEEPLDVSVREHLHKTKPLKQEAHKTLVYQLKDYKNEKSNNNKSEEVKEEYKTKIYYLRNIPGKEKIYDLKNNEHRDKFYQLKNHTRNVVENEPKRTDSLPIKTLHIQKPVVDSEVQTSKLNNGKMEAESTIEIELLTDLPEARKVDLSFPTLQVDLDKLSKEIKPELDASNMKSSLVPLSKLTNFPLLNEDKPGEFVQPTDVVHLSVAKNPLLRKLLQTFPSVTKVLNATLADHSRKALKLWRQNMTKYVGDSGFQHFYKAELCKGGEFHSQLQNYLLSRDSTMTSSSSPWLRSVSNILRDITDVSVIDSHVIHRNLAYRGVIDCVAKYRNTPVIIEWKRADRPKHLNPSLHDAPLQLSAYIGAINYDSNFKFQVKGGMIVMAYNDGSEAKVFEVHDKDCRKYWELWLSRLQKYRQFINNKSQSK